MKLIFSPARLATIIAISLLVFGSCKKEESNTNPAEERFASETTSEADAESEDIFNEIFDNVMGVNTDVAFGGTGVFGRMNPNGAGDVARVQACPNVTITHPNAPDIFPAKVVMDFGTGCTGRDGRTRSGKIITTYTKRLIMPGAVATTTFDGFTVDSIKVQGTHTITNEGESPLTVNCPTHKWKVTVERAKLTKPNGNYIEWNSTKTVTQIEGKCTPYIPLDDIFEIRGSSYGKVKRGDFLIAWNSEITDPLIKKFTCRWIVKGNIRIVRLNLTTNSPWIAAINYGAGTCDNQAVATINGVSHNITLP